MGCCVGMIGLFALILISISHNKVLDYIKMNEATKYEVVECVNGVCDTISVEKITE